MGVVNLLVLIEYIDPVLLRVIRFLLVNDDVNLEANKTSADVNAGSFNEILKVAMVMVTISINLPSLTFRQETTGVDLL